MVLNGVVSFWWMFVGVLVNLGGMFVVSDSDIMNVVIVILSSIMFFVMLCVCVCSV